MTPRLPLSTDGRVEGHPSNHPWLTTCRLSQQYTRSNHTKNIRGDVSKPYHNGSTSRLGNTVSLEVKLGINYLEYAIIVEENVKGQVHQVIEALRVRVNALNGGMDPKLSIAVL